MMTSSPREFAIITQWKEQEDCALVLQSLEYLDVVTLIQKKSVCKGWNQICARAIDNKCSNKKTFQSNEELKKAVNKYSPGYFNLNNKIQCAPKIAEGIASMYGYPIGKWDVSNINDFSNVFHGKCDFNEPIGSWDVSKATRMRGMFQNALSFNQDISAWNVSNVTTMADMFHHALEFNQDICSWNVSNVTNMNSMFRNATSYSQDISSWDISHAK